MSTTAAPVVSTKASADDASLSSHSDRSELPLACPSAGIRNRRSAAKGARTERRAEQRLVDVA
jgi:hypothetical protein